MGGHGGLNILPQKRWNVYNYENREKVRKDEEAAAREEHLKREQARKRDAQLRLDRLRTSRGLAPLKPPSPEEEPSAAAEVEPVESEPKTGHINLFEGIKIFDVVQVPKNDGPAEEEDKRRKRMRKEAAAAARAAAREAEARAFTPEDDKYRLGYGVAGKGVKLPWYLERRNGEDVDRGEDEDDDGMRASGGDERKKKSGKKSLQELREERLKREKREKERERALFMEQSRRSGGFSRR